MTASDWVLRGLGLLVGAVFAGVSFVANSRFAVTQGHDVIDWWTYLAATIGTDALKVLMPLFGIMLWTRGHKRWAFAAWGISTTCLAMSVVMALGWSSSSTGAVHGDRAKYAQQYADAKKAADDAQAKVDLIPPHRDADTLRGLINANTVPAKTWRSSAECTDATTEQSRNDCIPVLALRAELAAAESAPPLLLKRDSARRVLAGMAPPVEQVDPPADTLSKISRGAVAPTTARAFINGGWTLIIELCSTLTFTVAMLATGGVTVAPVKAPPQRVTVSDRVELPSRTPSPLSVGLKAPTHKALASTPRPSDDAPPPEALALWAATRLATVSDGRVGASEAHRDYLAWSKGKKLPAYTPQQFGMAAKVVLGDMGAAYVKGREGRYFSGVSITTGATIQ